MALAKAVLGGVVQVGGHHWLSTRLIAAGLVACALALGVDYYRPASTTKHVASHASGGMPIPLGLVFDDRLQVVDVSKGFAAERAGIRPGDRLKQIGGQTVSSRAEAVRSGQQAFQAHGPVDVVVARGGQELSFQLGRVMPPVPPPGPTPTGVPRAKSYL